jgi:transcriptional regulator with GAF, ATPase, and Fis domain
LPSIPLTVSPRSSCSLIQQTLAATGVNWALTARQLGLDASNLHKLARRLGMN